MMQLIKSTNILYQDNLIDGALLIDEGTIKAIYQNNQIPDGMKVIDYEDAYVLPGIIDLHMHGLLGWQAASTDQLEIEQLSKAVSSVGITAFQPSIADLPTIEDYFSCLKAVGNAKSRGAYILGAHMEGPYFHHDYRGCDLDRIIEPSLEDMKQAIKSANGKLTYVTLASELPHMDEIIPYLVNQHVRVGLGHSGASYQEAMKGFDFGANIMIHTGNGMRRLHQRDTGILGAGLLNHDVYAEVICDFYHCCPDFIDLVYRMKGKEHMLMISDSTEMSGMKEGTYVINDRDIHVKNGLVQLDDGTIAGSSKHVLYGMKNLYEQLHFSLSDISCMASLTPAKVMGIDQRKGSIEVGKDGDIMIVDQQFQCLATFVMGKQVYYGEDQMSLSNPALYEYLKS